MILFYKDSCGVYQWKECGLHCGDPKVEAGGPQRLCASVRDSDGGLGDSDIGLRESDSGHRDSDSGPRDSDSGVRLFGDGAF